MRREREEQGRTEEEGGSGKDSRAERVRERSAAQARPSSWSACFHYLPAGHGHGPEVCGPVGDTRAVVKGGGVRAACSFASETGSGGWRGVGGGSWGGGGGAESKMGKAGDVKPGGGRESGRRSRRERGREPRVARQDSDTDAGKKPETGTGGSGRGRGVELLGRGGVRGWKGWKRAKGRMKAGVVVAGSG